jgi:hypothetical protein
MYTGERYSPLKLEQFSAVDMVVCACARGRYGFGLGNSSFKPWHAQLWMFSNFGKSCRSEELALVEVFAVLGKAD